MSIATDREIIVKRLLHDDRWIKAEVVDVNFNNGKVIRDFLRITVKNGGYVMVVPRLTDGRFILTRQCRPVAGISVEGVAGGRQENESWEAAGRREMIEEVGYNPGKIVRLGEKFYPLTDRLDNPCHLFLAIDCVLSAEQADGDEVQGLEKLIVSKQEVLVMINDGRIKDLATLTGILGHLAFEAGALG